MKITETLAVSQNEFFDYIEKTINNALKNEGIEKNIYSGLEYQKRMKRDDNPEHDKFMKVKIDEFDRKGSYRSSFELDNMEYFVSYKIKHSTSDSIEVEYQEQYNRKSKLPKIISFILPHKVVKNTSKRMKAVLKQIEKGIIDSRG